MIKAGNLFELAEKQLIQEVDQRQRTRYGIGEVIDYAIKIRKWLDRYGKKGDITKAVFGKKEWRRQRYLKTGK